MSKSIDESSTQTLLTRSSKHSSGSRWIERDARIAPTHPQTIERWNTSRLLTILLDIGLLGLALCFAAYGITVKRWEGSPADSQTYRMLDRAARLAPTIFPILFAAIIGRALKAIALWRLEKGASLGHLDQLVGSTSITTTVTTQFKLRALNVLTLTLLMIWALSPLGGQGSIRILGTTTKYTNESAQVQYLNLTYFPPSYQSADTAGAFSQSNSLFAAALSSPYATRVSAIDTWGNFKVPVLETLSTSEMASDGWITPNLTNVEYASLIGLPISTIASGTNTYLNVETSYWHLDCPPLSVVQHPRFACNSSGWDNTANQNGQGIPGMYLSSHSDDKFDVWNRSSAACRQLRYCGWDNINATAVNCTMRNTYVEAEVHCVGLACSVSRIRESRRTNPPTCWTQLDYQNGSFGWYAGPFVQSLGSFHEAFTTTYQGFLVRPANPFNMTALDPVYNLSPQTFALRLSQLMNTYWYAALGSASIQYGVTNEDLNHTTAYYANTGGIVSITPATVESSRVVIVCNHSWLVILLLAVIVLVVVSVAGIVATSLSIGPEIAFNVSSMLKDSTYDPLSHGGSYLPAGDRSRMLKHIRVRYGDVDGDEDVGSIAIATPRATALRKDRLYA